MRNIFINSTILLFSIFITIVSAEFIVRLYVSPVNYLKPQLESDPILGQQVNLASVRSLHVIFRGNRMNNSICVLGFIQLSGHSVFTGYFQH